MTALGQRGMRFQRHRPGSTAPTTSRRSPHRTRTSTGRSRMEADRMVNSYVARKDLDSEMTVVRNEMESDENNAVAHADPAHARRAAYDWHNYGKDTIGARSDIENVDIARLQAFYHLYYQPDNAVLVVAGAFDPDKALALVAKYFGPIPKPTRVLPRLYTEEPVQDGERQVTLRRVGDTQWLADLYHTVPGAHPDAVAIEAAVDVMTVEPGGRLYKALVETQEGGRRRRLRLQRPRSRLRDVPGEGARRRTRSTARATSCWARSKASRRSRSPRKSSTACARRRCNRSRRPSTIRSGSASSLSESIAQGDWRLFFLRRDRWRKVTTADVDRVAATYFKPANRTVGEFIPDAKPDRSPTPPTVDVAAMVKDYKGDAAVAAGETFDATPANLDARAQRFTLANGMKVALLPKKTRGETVQFALAPALRRREIDLRTPRRGRAHRRDADARHDQAQPPADRGRARSAAREALGRRRHDRRVGARPDRARQSRADARPAGGGPARAVVPRNRAGNAQARGGRRDRGRALRSARDRRSRAGALRQSVPGRRRPLYADAR